jgi:hypothetical protein
MGSGLGRLAEKDGSEPQAAPNGLFNDAEAFDRTLA